MAFSIVFSPPKPTIVKNSKLLVDYDWRFIPILFGGGVKGGDGPPKK